VCTPVGQVGKRELVFMECLWWPLGRFLRRFLIFWDLCDTLLLVHTAYLSITSRECKAVFGTQTLCVVVQEDKFTRA